MSADFLPNVGGVAAHVFELGAALAAAGHRVTVVTPRRPGTPEEERRRGMTILRPRLPRPEPLFTLAMRRWLHRFVATDAPEVMHVHGLRPLPATRGLAVPVVFTNHTSGFLQRLEGGERARARVGARLAHLAHVLAPSRELAEATLAVGYRGPVDFLPNGVDGARFHPGPSPWRERLGIGEDETVVLLARRLVAKNGVREFARASAALAGRPVRIVVAGDGPEREAMADILAEGGMRERAHLLGALANEEMPALYRASDVSVLPSRQEATSITGLESMASGLPLVGTRVGGIPELVVHGETGLLVAPDNPASLGAAIARLVDDPRERREMGQRARARALTDFAWPAIAMRTSRIYAACTRCAEPAAR